MLKTEIVKVDERDIKVTELSFAAQLRLEKLDKITNEAIFQECLSKEDFDFLETVSKKNGMIIRQALWRVNGWDKIGETDVKKN